MVQRCFIDGLRFESPMAEQVFVETLDTTVLEGQSNSNWTRSVMVDHVPVRHEGEIIAVLTGEGEAGLTRIHSGLEREYRELFQRFAMMVEEGTFPLGQPEKLGEFREPRAGDGVMVLDRERRIEFASPNAVSALHRLGVQAELIGRGLDSIGIEDAVVRRALETRLSTITEIDHSDDLSVVLRCHPLLARGRSTGVLVLTRDVSELRSRAAARFQGRHDS